MYTTSKYVVLVLITIVVITWSCNIRDDLDHCGVYLEFIFDYNMVFADSFDPEVETVDVYIFDEDGKYLFHKHADCANDLIDRKRMFLNEQLPFGKYTLITVGGLSEHFRFTDIDDTPFMAGVTTIEQVKLSLYRQANEVSHKFTHLWFGESTEIHYRADLSVWPIYLIRNTNNFHILFHDRAKEQIPQTGEKVPYTFEIVTPESAAYGYNNNPLTREFVTYHPFYLEWEEEAEDIFVGKLNTMRLFADDPDGYRLVIRDNATSEKVWEYDLMVLLRNMKPTRPDGTRLSLQEYLDRQAEWNIIILYSEGPDSSGDFIALRIIVNGWIIWQNDIEV